MSNTDKLGPYIQRLMITVLDKEQDEFVQHLAWTELRRLNVDLEEFLRKHQEDDFEKQKKTKKQLLQEDKENVKNK